ncbi:uncharacterized protein TNCV_1258291 [Trichonephila clavipes]|nr:uncharacterized protein TNCV_1258291 [Trichonephila clavipes]
MIIIFSGGIISLKQLTVFVQKKVLDDQGCNRKPNVRGSVYLDALKLWLFPQLEESEANNFICQFIKDCTNVPPLSADLPDSRHRIEAAVTRTPSDTQQKVWDELVYRLDLCRVTKGAHIEHL